MQSQRHGFVLRVKLERLEEYKEYHRAVWPEILEAINEAGIRNYTIFLKDDLLFGYYEYVGPPTNTTSASKPWRRPHECASGGTSWSRCRSR